MLKRLYPLLALLIVGLPFTPSPAPALGVSQPRILPEIDDEAILATMAQKDSAWITLGSLAVTHGQSAAIKDLGQALIRDFTAHLKAVRALASKLKLSVGPDVQSADLAHDWDAAMQGLSANAGASFDTPFLDLVNETSAGALDQVRNDWAPGAQDPGVKQLADALLRPLGAHLTSAKRILSTMGSR